MNVSSTDHWANVVEYMHLCLLCEDIKTTA